ncbi:ectonucleoside triphosphate diphosphohydrolase [Legionella geestiana]|uniref:Ectonucleoside triphosphate diphosphohydrolase n=1 Tax=Legionella geestiana TaxID=45065 RepID=A0A0W0U3R4_9GAMM|nr:hypothetical protein [Legionella geestiana]KTD02121.1 ectonucleoside triphosphate diphosphohydrolase [Legionella geestiana]QBS11555.1 multidrug DMT transporter permease [Legionella geestiana]QDQ40837.1 multidrug DMT transporter permease [Legionella geestiana]STX53771.1 ectonucleoside triphosphate diphosphohydrolase [Legionella geestiana]
MRTSYLAASLLWVMSFNVFAGIEACTEETCMAVVDAGSTGSRLHVYAYTDAQKGPINIHEVYSKKVTPGFATLSPDADAINAYLDNLMPQGSNMALPLYFYATGGMRLLPPNQQDARYAQLRQWFGRQSDWSLKAARTVPGKDEAVWGWLAVNYQLGRLQTSQIAPAGVLDMGGASVQITFPIDAKRTDAEQDIETITVYGQRITLFARTFLGLGQTDMSHQFLDAAACFPKGYPLPDGGRGEGDARQCRDEVARLVNDVQRVNVFVEPSISKAMVTDWYTLSGLASLVQNPPYAIKDATAFTMDDLLQEADNRACQRTWKALNEDYADNGYLFGSCLFPAYYYALVMDGYGLPAGTPINTLASSLSGDWTLGVVLHPA